MHPETGIFSEGGALMAGRCISILEYGDDGVQWEGRCILYSGWSPNGGQRYPWNELLALTSYKTQQRYP